MHPPHYDGVPSMTRPDGAGVRLTAAIRAQRMVGEPGNTVTHCEA